MTDDKAPAQRGGWEGDRSFPLPDDPTLSVHRLQSFRSDEISQAIRQFAGEEFLRPRIGMPQDGREVFHLEKRIGEGGFGEIWQAEQGSLSRLIAVKRLKLEDEKGPFSSGARDFRNTLFLREAYTTALLDHPFIVPVYALGVDQEGRDALGMKLVEGDSWSSLLGRDFGKLPVDEFLQKHVGILVSVTQAVAFAHSRGVIHRDIKPSQVMLGRFGEIYLMDWGLAYIIETADHMIDSQHPVHTGQRLQELSNPAGTPAYMAPEQTLSTTERLGPWTDVYLLGATLYHLLAGAPPHSSNDSQISFAKAKEGELVPPSKAAKERLVPRELEEVCLRAMAADPEKRHGSAEEFLADLSGFLTGQTRKKEAAAIVEKHRGKLGQSELTYPNFNALLADLERARVLNPASEEAEALHQETLRHYAERALDNGDLVLARSNAGRLTDAATRASLEAQVDAVERAITRRDGQRRLAFAGIAILALVVLAGTIRYTIVQRSLNEKLALQRDRADSARQAAEEARENTAAALNETQREQYLSAIIIADNALDKGDLDKAREYLFDRAPSTFRNWEWGHLAARFFSSDVRWNDSPNFHAAWMPGGQEIIVGGRKVVRFYSLNTGELLRTIEPSTHINWNVAASPDGRMLGVTSFDGKAYLLDAETGREIRHYSEGTLLRACTFSSDGKLFAYCGDLKRVPLVETATGKKIRIFDGFGDGVYDISFSPDGTRLLTSSLDHTAVTWDVTTGKKLLTLEHPENVLAGVFSPDGRYLLTACADRNWRVFDAGSGELLRMALNPDAYLHDIAISPDGTIVATSDNAGTCRLWDFESSALLASIESENPIIKVAFSPDGESVAYTSYESVRITSVDRILRREELDPDPSPETIAGLVSRARVYGVPLDRDRVWAVRDASWNVDSGITAVKTLGHEFGIVGRYEDFSANGRLRLSYDYEKQAARLVRVADGGVLNEYPAGQYYDGRISPDGRYVALGEAEAPIVVYDVASGEEVARFVPPSEDPEKPTAENLNFMVFSPDGRRLAMAFLSGRCFVWDFAAESPAREFERIRGSLLTVAFSSDGALLAGGGGSRSITLWDVATGTIEKELPGHKNSILGISFSPDGERLVSFANRLDVRVWDVATGRETILLEEYESDNAPLAAAFTHDGRHVFVATQNHSLDVYEAFPWDGETYAADADASLEQRIERFKRSERMAPHSQP
ncbi:MAG: hypothetical protein PWP23_1817 [Candidatus Sumerlaeota bacterium]|nr:hypothetical protein [Candidatus Sumerlaeota bacterium]